MSKIENTSNESKPLVVMLSHNRHDSSFLRRVEMFGAAGAHVTTFSFHRDSGVNEDRVEWCDHDLGFIPHGQFFVRTIAYFRALSKLFRYRDLFRKADIVHARNLDLYLLLMFLSKIFCFKKFNTSQKSVYEAIDVHFALTKPGIKAKILRFLERKALKHASTLITTSPGFVKNYFVAIQKYSGTVHMIENKLTSKVESVQRLPLKQRDSSKPIRIAWVGNLRCPTTLEALLGCAENNLNRITLKFAGRVSRFILHDFDERIKGLDNVEYTGVFDWPDGLAEVYEGVDLCWSHDVHKLDENCGWLLPNRIYEAGYFSVPSIAVDGSETATYVREKNSGFIIDHASAESLQSLIDSITDDELNKMQIRLREMDVTNFVSTDEDAHLLLQRCVSSR